MTSSKREKERESERERGREGERDGEIVEGKIKVMSP
jgi:hypothetical protein